MVNINKLLNNAQSAKYVGYSVDKSSCQMTFEMLSHQRVLHFCFAASSTPSSDTHDIWHVNIEAPLVFQNLLPFCVDVCLDANKGLSEEVLHSVPSCQIVNLYDHHGWNISRIKVRPRGYEFSEWIDLSTDAAVDHRLDPLQSQNISFEVSEAPRVPVISGLTVSLTCKRVT